MCGKGLVQILQLQCFMILDGGLVGLPPFPQALLLLLNGLVGKLVEVPSKREWTS